MTSLLTTSTLFCTDEYLRRPNMMAVFNRLKQKTMPIAELQKNKQMQNTASLRDQLRTKVVMRKPDVRRRQNPMAKFQANLKAEQKKDQIRASGKIPSTVLSKSGNKNSASSSSKRPTLSARDRLKSVLSRPKQVRMKPNHKSNL